MMDLPDSSRRFFNTAISCVLDWTRLVKRSQALRGRNLTRDSQADGAPMVHQASDDDVRQRPHSDLSDTGAMPPKIPGSGAEPHRLSPDSRHYCAHPDSAGRAFIMRIWTTDLLKPSQVLRIQLSTAASVSEAAYGADVRSSCMTGAPRRMKRLRRCSFR